MQNCYVRYDGKRALTSFCVMNREMLPVAIAVGTIVYLTFYYVPQLDAAGETLGAVDT